MEMGHADRNRQEMHKTKLVTIYHRRCRRPLEPMPARALVRTWFVGRPAVNKPYLLTVWCVHAMVTLQTTTEDIEAMMITCVDLHI